MFFTESIFGDKNRLQWSNDTRYEPGMINGQMDCVSLQKTSLRRESRTFPQKNNKITKKEKEKKERERERLGINGI